MEVQEIIPVFDGAASIEDLGNHRIKFTYIIRVTKSDQECVFQIRRTVAIMQECFLEK